MSEPSAIGSKGRKVDDIVTEIERGPRAKPAYSRPATPERNDSYDDMEKRIYGDKSAKAKK
jgi:hypothetical protein